MSLTQGGTAGGKHRLKHSSLSLFLQPHAQPHRDWGQLWSWLCLLPQRLETCWTQDRKLLEVRQLQRSPNVAFILIPRKIKVLYSKPSFSIFELSLLHALLDGVFKIRDEKQRACSQEEFVKTGEVTSVAISLFFPLCSPTSWQLQIH